MHVNGYSVESVFDTDQCEIFGGPVQFYIEKTLFLIHLAKSQIEVWLESKHLKKNIQKAFSTLIQ